MTTRRGDRIRGGRATHGGILLVPCLVNQAYRYWFLVDTGTAMTMVSREVAEEIGLDLKRSGSLQSFQFTKWRKLQSFA